MSYAGASHDANFFTSFDGKSQRELTMYVLERRDEHEGWDEIERFLRRKQARMALRRRVKDGARRRDLRIVKTLTTIKE